MKKKILIFGASGLIGRYVLDFLRKSGEEAIGTYNSNPREGLVHFDLTTSRLSDLDLEGITHAVICSAIAKVDTCKENEGYSREVNCNGVKRLIYCLCESGIFPIFFSSASVFNGEKGGYTEESEKDPRTTYGQEKASVEDFMREHIKRSLVIRPGKTFGVRRGEGVLFTDWLEKYLSGIEIFCAKDEKLSPTYSEDIARGVLSLIRLNKTGIYNFNPQEYMSRLEMAERFFRHLNIDDAIVHPCSIDDLNLLEKRPKCTFLDPSKFLREVHFSFTRLEDCFDLIKEHFKFDQVQAKK
jgi:dTDP-4-dehydrorhamnose reductase